MTVTPGIRRPQARYAAEDLRQLARYASVDLSGASAQQIIRWAWDTLGEHVVVSQSMANTTLAHLVDSVAPDIPVAFLETGYHFEETLATRDALAARTNLTIINVTPRQTVAEQDAEFGPDLWQRDPDLCCAMRKVEPMEELLVGFDGWITGLRVAATPHRAGTPVVTFDERRGVLKIAPILHWSDAQLLRYTIENDVPVNPLMYQGYPSIGCSTCTHAVGADDDPRAGRWRGLGKTECGLHI